MLVIVSPSTNLIANRHRFRSLDSIDIDHCDPDIIPYKIDIQNIDQSTCPYGLQHDDKNQALHVTYRPRSSITYVNVAVLW